MLNIYVLSSFEYVFYLEKKKMKEHCRSSPQGMCPELYLKENSFSP